MNKLFGFLRQFFQGRFFGTITIRFESGKVSHVTVETKQLLEYKELGEAQCLPTKEHSA